MALRTGHGQGRGTPHIEVLPIDELPAPIPDEGAPLNRRADGTFADSATAKALGAKGGRAKFGRTRLMTGMGLADIAEDSSFAPYANAGNEFAKMQIASLASQCGGDVGPGPSTFIMSGAMQLAASRWVGDRAIALSDPDLFKKSSDLMNASRQNIIAAFELATREAHLRASMKGPQDPLAAFMLPEEPSK